MTARRSVLLLIAAVLMSFGFPLSNAPVQAQRAEKDTVALAQSVVNGIPPVRAVGRPAADPGLLRVQSHTEGIGAPAAAEPVLVRLGGQDVDVPTVSREAALPVADGRAPPVRQAAL